MTEFKTLYKRNANGSINHWSIKVEGNSYYTVYGQIGGATVTSNKVWCYGKNKGKVNETSDEEQAEKNALAEWKLKKKSENFVENIDDVDKIAFNPPMLAKVYDKKYTSDIKFMQPKYDGIRCNIHWNGEEIEAISRRNNMFYSVDHIKESLTEWLKAHPTIHLDGELYNHKLHDDFNKIVSLVKKQKLTEEDLKETKAFVRYTIYDIWDDSNTNMTFSERTKFIHENLEGIDFIDLAPTFNVSNQEEIDDYFHKFIADGYEGGILRKDAPYEHKRSKNLLKYKEFMDDEFPILEICQGKKELQAEYCWIDLKNGNKCKATLAFNDEECFNLLENKEKYLGKLATVRFFGWTTDGSLRFPVVKTIRDYE